MPRIDPSQPYMGCTNALLDKRLQSQFSEKMGKIFTIKILSYSLPLLKTVNKYKICMTLNAMYMEF